MTKPYTCPQRFYEPLQFVATVSEVAEHWHRHRTTVLYAIHAENIAAVKSGRTWLISVPSVTEFWGYPPALLGVSQSLDGPKTPLQIIRGGGLK